MISNTRTRNGRAGERYGLFDAGNGTIQKEDPEIEVTDFARLWDRRRKVDTGGCMLWGCRCTMTVSMKTCYLDIRHGGSLIASHWVWLHRERGCAYEMHWGPNFHVHGADAVRQGQKSVAELEENIDARNMTRCCPWLSKVEGIAFNITNDDIWHGRCRVCLGLQPSPFPSFFCFF